MSEANDIARTEAEVDALLGELVAIHTTPRAMALKEGLVEDRTRSQSSASLSYFERRTAEGFGAGGRGPRAG